MNLRTWIRILVAVGAVLVVASAASAGQNPKLRPFWGTVVGDVHWEYAAGTCPTQGGYSTVSDAVGQMTHLGRTTFNEVHCAGGGDGLPLDGAAVFTAANGDDVLGTYVVGSAVWLDPPLIGEEALYTITGGTGRFENATGNFKLTVLITPTGDPIADPSIHWPATFVFDGKIRY